jgi:hypothetical protein
VVNVNALSSKIQDKIRREPNVKYHEEDMLELENIVRELRKI